MSLRVKSGCKIEIAEKDIVCRKVIARTDNPEIWRGHYIYDYYDYFNKELQATEHLSIIKQDNEDIICSGFNAFLDEFSINCRIDCNLDTVECTGVTAIIPKGAEYCYGKDNDIISNRMIIRSYDQNLCPYLFHVQSGCNIEKSNKSIPCRIIVPDDFEFNRVISLKLIGEGYLFNHLLPVPCKNSPKIIKNGFISYIKPSKKTSLICEGGNFILRFAIIPKGAEYCFGDNDDVISNQIIVFSSEEEMNKYLKSCVY